MLVERRTASWPCSGSLFDVPCKLSKAPRRRAHWTVPPHQQRRGGGNGFCHGTRARGLRPIALFFSKLPFPPPTLLLGDLSSYIHLHMSCTPSAASPATFPSPEIFVPLYSKLCNTWVCPSSQGKAEPGRSGGSAVMTLPKSPLISRRLLSLHCKQALVAALPLLPAVLALGSPSVLTCHHVVAWTGVGINAVNSP